MSETFQRYSRKNVRIGADIPTELRDSLHATIPPGFLSEIIRKLLEAFLDLQKEVGVVPAIKALTHNRISLSVEEIKEENEEIKEEEKDKDED